MENLNQLFSNLGTEQSILILSWLIIAFLLGLLAGYFLRNRYVNELNKQLDEKERLLAAKQLELDQVQHELALKEADLKRAAFEAEEAQSKIRRNAEEVGRLNQLVASAQLELDKTKAGEQASASIINDLNDQILGLKTKNAQLVEGGAMPTEVNTAGSGEALDRLARIEMQLARLTEENSSLLQILGESSVDRFVGNQASPQMDGQLDSSSGISEPGGEFFVPKDVPAEPVKETPNFGGESTDLFNTDKVLLRTVDKNDLTAIEGIGPFLEKKLNDAGVFTYADIAAWDAEKIAEITTKISFFEGRIEKDDWVGQAQRLVDKKPEGLAGESIIAESRSLTLEEKHVVPAMDNLKLIMGIDESIEKVLFASGINSFAELAKMDPDELRNILVVVDAALSNVDPSAWPAQARLAFDEEWEVLEDYKEQLKGTI